MEVFSRSTLEGFLGSQHWIQSLPWSPRWCPDSFPLSVISSSLWEGKQIWSEARCLHSSVLNIKSRASQERTWERCEPGGLQPRAACSWNPTRPTSFGCFLRALASCQNPHTLADFLPRDLSSSLWHILNLSVNLFVWFPTIECKPYKGRALSNLLFLLLCVLP